jgi:hypothetical protein
LIFQTGSLDWNLILTIPPVSDDWKFEDYFGKLSVTATSDFCSADILKILADNSIEKHQFFDLAKSKKCFLTEWVKQECIVTNHFSLALLCFLASIKNVHLRSLLMPVVTGEHSKLRDGVAFGSHPYLLAKLAADLSIDSMAVKPEQFTIDFIETLFSETKSTAYRLGLLGIGNEALLIPEYTAVRDVFALHYDRKLFRPFLTANIEEDSQHASLMETAARFVCKSQSDWEEFILGGRDGVNARIQYYDALVAHSKGLTS